MLSHYRHGNPGSVGGIIAFGFLLAAGFWLFSLTLTVASLVVLAVWSLTSRLPPILRNPIRGIFVTVAILGLLVALIVLLG